MRQRPHDQPCRSRLHTGKLVAESTPTMEIKCELAPGVTMTFDMIGQPQMDDARVFELALRHFQAFYFFITMLGVRTEQALNAEDDTLFASVEQAEAGAAVDAYAPEIHGQSARAAV